MKYSFVYVVLCLNILNAQDSLTLDDIFFNTTSPLTIGGHAKQYNQAIQVDELYTVSTDLAQTDLDHLAHQLLSSGDYDARTQFKTLGRLNQVWLFTDQLGDFQTLMLDQIKGFYLIFFDQQRFVYQQVLYIQRGGRLQLIHDFTRQSEARTFNSMDTMRSLHLACVMPDPSFVPTDTTMYRLTSNTAKWGSDDTLDWDYATLVATHPVTKISRLTSRQYQGNIELMARQLKTASPGKRFEYYCGEATTLCNPDPAFPVCNGRYGRCDSGSGGCKMAEITDSLEESVSAEYADQDINAFYYFRDEILSKSERGRTYINYWYAYSQHIKLVDTSHFSNAFSRLQVYSALFTETIATIETISDDKDQNSILISESLNKTLQMIIKDHRGIDPGLDQALDQLDLSRKGF